MTLPVILLKKNKDILNISFKHNSFHVIILEVQQGWSKGIPRMALLILRQKWKITSIDYDFLCIIDLAN